jgi:hypothetical protein
LAKAVMLSSRRARVNNFFISVVKVEIVIQVVKVTDIAKV